MKIAILGFGREGKSILKFLKKSSRYRNADIAILDQKLDKNYLENLEKFNLVFRSPGVPYNFPEIQKAIKRGVRFSSATKLFFDEMVRRGSPQVIGVTGTKGKGTTSTLIYQILKNSGRKVLLAGNIGKPAIDLLSKIDGKTIVILELSSFQLQDLEKSPEVAVVADVFPDHLDAHKNMQEYLNAKSNITKYQKKSDVVFYFRDNLLSRVIAKKSPGAKIGIAGNPFGLKKNFMMASTVAEHLGCPRETIAKTLKNFRGLEHRLEFVRELNGIKFYNDSASTNPQTAAAAVHSLSSAHCPLILIAGGKDKNLNYAPLAKAIKKSGQVKEIVLIGENKSKIRSEIRNSKIVIRNCDGLGSAVRTAYGKARSLITNYQLPVTIVFSPGAASFDMFQDYADRGKQFKKIVKKIKNQ